MALEAIDNFREGRDVDVIDAASQQRRRRLSAPQLYRARKALRLSAKLAPAFYQPKSHAMPDNY
jgi:hypothetical protein